MRRQRRAGRQSPRGTFWCKVLGTKGLSLDFGVRFFPFVAEAKARLLARLLFFSLFNAISFVFLYFYFNKLGLTKMPDRADIFLACRLLILSRLRTLPGGF